MKLSAQTIQNPVEADSFSELITSILDGVVVIMVPILVVVFIFIGVSFLFAQGKPEKLKDAKSALFYAFIGALIVFGAKGISIIIENTASELISESYFSLYIFSLFSLV